MESIDKLRRALNSCMHTEKTEKPFDTYWITVSACDMLIDEIEREVADRYMKLPVDADGIPIHVGDRLEYDGAEIGSVTAVGFNAEPRVWVLSDGKNVSLSFCASNVKHHRQQTVEDVLRDVVTLCANTWKDNKSAFRHYDVDDVMESGNIAGFADEIRKLTDTDE